jgi:predicted nucleic acid-binding Zn ribbon protein
MECDNKRELKQSFDMEYNLACSKCNGEMRRVPSVPASFKVGKYGKGGGK